MARTTREGRSSAVNFPQFVARSLANHRLRSTSLLWFAALLVCCLGLSKFQLHARIGNIDERFVPNLAASRCVGWRETQACHPLGAVNFNITYPCDVLITNGSGYCLCEGQVAAYRVGCGSHHFTCNQKCGELESNPSKAVLLPQPLTCNNHNRSISLSQLGLPPRVHHNTSTASPAVGEQQQRLLLEAVWSSIQSKLQQYNLSDCSTPAVRDNKHDWVREGRGLSRRTVIAVKERLSSFLAAAPPYPGGGVFEGRGIAIIGGKMRYLVPAWLAVIMLRRSGCTLPVEMWFPPSEPPLPMIEQELAALGVTCRKLDFPGVTSTGYAMKAGVLLLSSFREVLFLDSDIIAVRDPEALFESDDYKAKGAMLWPDFWEPTVAREVAQLLDIPHAEMPTRSFESGQMVFDKQRHWHALLVAAYMNANSHFFHELLSCYLGKGDKETFAYSILAVGDSYYMASQPLGSLGQERLHCEDQQGTVCTNRFVGNTMVQHSPEGDILFLHANFDKFGLHLPASFQDYTRRWLLLEPGGLNFLEWSETKLGYDVERLVFQALQHIACHLHELNEWQPGPWRPDSGFTPWGALQPGGFHTMPRGMDFWRMYLKGYKGAFELLFTPTPAEVAKHLWQRHMRPIPKRTESLLKYPWGI